MYTCGMHGVKVCASDVPYMRCPCIYIYGMPVCRMSLCVLVCVHMCVCECV